MKEALLLEMNKNNKEMIVSVIYHSPSQNNREFDSFLLNFEQVLSDISTHKPPVSIIKGDFNARSSSWWSDDINISEGTLIVITKFYTLALILILLTTYHTSVLYGITKRQILKKLEKHLI